MIYLLYLDESGTPELKGGTAHFVFTGLAIPSDSWADYDHRIQLLKQKHHLNLTEIHSAWMMRRYQEQERIPDFSKLDFESRKRLAVEIRKANLLMAAATKTGKQLRELQKNYRYTAPYLHLSLPERLAFLQAVADEISTWTEARIFGEAINKKIYTMEPHRPLYEDAFSQVITRFETFLQNRGAHLNQKLLGMIIQDNNPTMEKRLTQMMREFFRKGTYWRSIDRIIETPLFVNSSLTEMIQLADLCGYALRRYFDNQRGGSFSKNLPKDRSGEGKSGWP